MGVAALCNGLRGLINTGDFCLQLNMTAQAVEERRLQNRDVITWYNYSRPPSFRHDSRKVGLLFIHLSFSLIKYTISVGEKWVCLYRNLMLGDHVSEEYLSEESVIKRSTELTY